MYIYIYKDKKDKKYIKIDKSECNINEYIHIPTYT